VTSSDAAGATARAQHLRRVQRVYRAFAPVYDVFRRLWGFWTRSSERALDRLCIARITDNARILELGPGTGVNLERLQRLEVGFEHYVGIDSSEPMLDRLRAKLGRDDKIDLRVGDITDLSGTRERFDFVISTWVLSHLTHPAETARQAIDLLEPGGTAVFLFSATPTSGLLRACLSPFYGWAEAGFIDPAEIEALPNLEVIERRSAGLAAITVFRGSGKSPDTVQ
jgi:SAM-dependent methyltransferase